jgi:hypothetical protein
MDDSRFDRLGKVLAARHPRRAALLLLAVCGLGLPEVEEMGTAKAKREKTIRVCNCSGPDALTCKNQKKARDKAKQLLKRNRCAYRGRCTGVSGCAITAPPLPPPL